MLSTTDHLAQIADLERQNRELREQLALARGRLLVYSNFHGNIYGEFGEQFIAQCPEVVRVFGNKGHDGTTNAGKYEVKFSSLLSGKKYGPAGSWQWGKIKGMQGRKDFDYLILIGHREATFGTAEKYHASKCNFAFFVIPRADVSFFLTPGRPELKLNAAPRADGPSSRTHLIHRYHYTQEDLVSWLSQPTAPECPRPELRRPQEVLEFLASQGSTPVSQQNTPAAKGLVSETNNARPG